MKVKIDNPTLKAIVTVCKYSENVSFEKPLVALFIGEELAQFQKKCESKKHQKQITLTPKGGELLAIETMLTLIPYAPESIIIREYFLNPILKQLQ